MNDRGLDGSYGLGKSDRWKLLANELGWKFMTPTTTTLRRNIEKLRRGIPLTDEDRKPWLQTLAELIDDARILATTSFLVVPPQA